MRILPIITALSTLVGAGTLTAQTETEAATAIPEPATFAAAADPWIAGALESAGVVPGLAVAVVRGAEVVYLRGFGTADREAGVAATPETAFYIASATKPFTALAAALLDHGGALDLDAPIARYLPDVAFDPAVGAGAVTLRDLLTHRHGLDNDAVVFRTAFSGEHTPAELRRVLAATTVNAEAPRGTFQYTNVGYNVLSLILDQERGTPWQTLLDTLIFTPLGMDRTTAYVSEAKRERWPLAAPYDGFGAGEGGFARLYLEKEDATMHAAGGLVATAADLARWLEVQLNDGRLDGRQLFPAAVIAETHRLQVETDADYGPFHRKGYGLGWYVGEYDGDTLMHHFGGFAGFHAHLSFMPERDLGVVVLANASEGGGRLASLVATFLYDSWRGRPDALARAEEQRLALVEAVAERRQRLAAERTAQTDPPWTLSRPAAAYAGRYVNPLYGTLEVTATEGPQSAPSVRIGLLHTVATPHTEPDTMTVELVPGQKETLRFTLDDSGRAVSASYEDVVFERLP